MRPFSRRRLIFHGLAGALVLSAVPLWPRRAAAQTLDQLRASGAVGEAFDGFARVRKPVPGAKALVDRINAKRREIYAKRAAEQGITLDQVGRVYAGEIFRKAPPGTWFLQESGAWVQK